MHVTRARRSRKGVELLQHQFQLGKSGANDSSIAGADISMGLNSSTKSAPEGVELEMIRATIEVAVKSSMKDDALRMIAVVMKVGLTSRSR